VGFHHRFSVFRQQFQDLLDRPTFKVFHQVKSLDPIALVFELEHNANFGQTGGDPDDEEVEPSEVVFDEFEVAFRNEYALLLVAVNLPPLKGGVERLDLSLYFAERKALGDLIYFGLLRLEDALAEQQFGHDQYDRAHPFAVGVNLGLFVVESVAFEYF
jgi:hypothetical protein